MPRWARETRRSTWLFTSRRRPPAPAVAQGCARAATLADAVPFIDRDDLHRAAAAANAPAALAAGNLDVDPDPDDDADDE